MLDSEQKREIVAGYARAYGMKLFIETGTAEGFTIEGVRRWVERVISIEIDPGKYLHAWRTFIDDPQVTIIHGDSAEALESVLRFHPVQPSLFWLDGHWNEGFTQGIEICPIKQELGHIMHHSPLGHVILIDDARLFGSDPAYPTIDWVCGFVDDYSKGAYEHEVLDDIIRFTPL